MELGTELYEREIQQQIIFNYIHIKIFLKEN